MSEAVVSTRIRLARNLREYPFPIRLKADKAQEIVAKVGEALADCGIKFHKIDSDNVSDTILVSMIERHLVSPDFVNGEKGRAVYLSDDNTVKVHMSNIRSKLKKLDPDNDYIETVWGMGYRLT